MEGHGLEDVVGLLNRMLTSSERNRSATLAVLELDLESGTLTAVNAGHLPVLLLGPDGEPRFVDRARTGPIGVRPAERYSAERHPFPVGSVMLLYTDGLVERRGESIDVGLERLRTAAARAAKSSDGRFADRVYRTLASQTSVDDDLALLVIELLPLGPELELTARATTSIVPDLRRTVARWLVSQGCTEDERLDIALATSEAASNAIEHAYGASEATFTVRCERNGDVIRTIVRDTGRWRETKPFGRGRGLKVMRGLMDSVDVKTGGSGTTVTLTKRIGDPSDA
jgi:anti-sigma regulatory factor (Ser/Thr protein kinase)